MKFDQLTILFLMGLFFSFLSHVGEALEHDRYKGKTKNEIRAIIVSKMFLGGTVTVIVFFGLSDNFPQMSEGLIVGLSGAGAYFSETISLTFLAYLKKRYGGKEK